MDINLSSGNPKLTDVQVAILAKAPLPGYAKTRLMPAIGATGAAQLQRSFTKHAVRTALEAGLGSVTLWCAPNWHHPLFRALSRRFGIRLLAQADGDLGMRMHTAFRLHCPRGPVLLIGTDCPALTAEHLRVAAYSLLKDKDAVFYPAADGGYVLVGLREPQHQLFERMPWSTSEVMEQTLTRAASSRLRTKLFEPLADIDTPDDLENLAQVASVGKDVRWPRQLKGFLSSPRSHA